VPREQLQHGQREPGGLAGAGLRGGEKIAARENDRDGLRLDGGGLGVALLGNSLKQLGRKTEILERRIDETLLMVYQEEDVRGLRPLGKPLLKSAREGLAFTPVQADVLR
jgi:hypothetical protein